MPKLPKPSTTTNPKPGTAPAKAVPKKKPHSSSLTLVKRKAKLK